MPHREAADGPSTVPWVRNATHELIGVTCALGASRALDLDTVETVLAAGAAAVGSWLPDADRLGTRVHRRSRLERRSLIARALGMVLRAPLVAFALVARHRGITHSLVACVLVGAGAVGLGLLLPAPGWALGGGLALGYLAHVLADACTPSGVALWAPFDQRRVWLVAAPARIRTGSVREALLAAVSAVAALALAFA